MKNFTNNFKQFTSRLSARWLIMALMLLLGTGSAWAVDYYLRGTFNNWGTNNKFLNNTCTITLEADKEYTFKIASSDWNNDNTYGKTNSHITETCEIELLNNTNNQAAGDCKITTKDAGSYTFVFTPNGSKGTLEVTYPTPTPTAPVVSTISATINGDDLVCEGKITSMGSATTVVWAFTVLSTDAISKAHSDWKYPDGQNQITTANTDFEYSIPISSLSLTSGTTYYVRAMAVDLGNLGFSNNQYGNAVAGSYITFVYDPCTPPAAPTFDPIPAKCGSYTLPTEDKNQVNVNWYTAATGGNKITSVNTTGTYYAEAVDGTCTSAERTPVQITINTIPTISISSENNSAVLYEDVTLTATGTNINEVNWSITDGTGTLSNTTGTSVKLTSSTAGTVKVKATATSVNSCTKESNELSVTFANETCNNVADMTKIYLDVSENTGFITGNNAYVSVTASGNNSANCDNTSGANQNSYVPKNDTWWGTMTKVAGENYIYEITIPNNVTINKGTTKLSFWNNSISGNSDVWEVQAILGQTISAGTNCMKLSNKTKTHNDDRHSHLYCGTWTTYKNAPAITAPAAKTISVSTTDGEGNIIFSGQVVKTGCDNTNEYGFQYSSDEQTWTTVKVGENAVAGTAIYNNTVNGLDGPFYVRAYITNDNSTQYGEIKEITVSTEKDPITSVTLTHVKDANGTTYEPSELANLIYCVGDEVWFELNYVGSKFIPENNVGYKWTTCPGNGLIGPYNGNKYKFTITGSGTIGISLRNEANVDLEGNPTWVESDPLGFNTHPEPTAPYISIDPASGVLCEGNTATITVTNPSTDCSYKLVEEGSKAGFTPYTSGDLTYTVQNEGKYYVVAQHDECPTNEYTSNQVAINQVISTSATISIEPDEEVTTTPWEPVTITVNPQEGYVYELSYTNNNLAGVAGVIIKQNGDSYTYYIPRPDSWGTGDATPVRTAVEYGIKAQLKVDGEASQCDLDFATATIQLKDEDNENCPQ